MNNLCIEEQIFILESRLLALKSLELAGIETAFENKEAQDRYRKGCEWRLFELKAILEEINKRKEA